MWKALKEDCCFPLKIALLWSQYSHKENWPAAVEYTYNPNIHEGESGGLEPDKGQQHNEIISKKKKKKVKRNNTNSTISFYKSHWSDISLNLGAKNSLLL